MNHTGNKTQRTIICEEVFISVMRTVGLNVFYETMFRNSITGRRTIDFVVGEPYSKDGVCFCGMVGVELKTQKEDLLRKTTGKSFKSFPFNYLFVSDEILDDAIKFIGENNEYSHVGIIVLREDCDVSIYKTAEFYDINLEYYGELKNDIERNKYEEYCDSIACAFAKFGKVDYGTIHNFANKTTYRVKYDCFFKKAIIEHEKKPVSGTVPKARIDNFQIKMSCI